MIQTPSHGLSSMDVCAEVGCSYRMLDYWIRCGLVTPSIDPGTGSGRARRFSEADLATIRHCARASKLINMSLQEAVAYVRDIDLGQEAVA